ncbi:MAG: hypothetical protein Q4C47_03805, partial [Planctomycetia bacterium]|nr:hypothetical protein [Planctomycetia bacterium]
MSRTRLSRLRTVGFVGLWFCVVLVRCAVADVHSSYSPWSLNRAGNPEPELVVPASDVPQNECPDEWNGPPNRWSESSDGWTGGLVQRKRMIQLSEGRTLLRQRLIYQAESWLKSREMSGRKRTNEAQRERAAGRIVAEFLRDGSVEFGPVSGPRPGLSLSSGRGVGSGTCVGPSGRVEKLHPEAMTGISAERMAKVTEFLSGNWEAPDLAESRVSLAVHAVKGPVSGPL